MIDSRILLVAVVVVCGACTNQRLTDEQRNQLIEEKKNRKIKKLSPSQILEKANELAIIRLESRTDVDTVLLSETLFSEYYQQMSEAYQYAIAHGKSIADNIEERNDGNIYFTRPIRREKKVIGFVVILLEKKDVVKSM